MRLRKTITIDIDDEHYLSFPDIIRSLKNPDTFFMVYRSGNGHHPTFSKLILKESKNKGRTWNTIQEIESNIEDHGYVWNCPRLSYLKNSLHIICDAKSGTYERVAHFKTVFIVVEEDGLKKLETPIPGMVPDKIIAFQGQYFCANHKIKDTNNKLIQLMSWSRDGILWYDTNIVAHSYQHQFCEGSVVNMNDKYLIAYLRDNSGHKKNIYTVKSTNGKDWTDPKALPIFGQRVTALKHSDNRVVGAFRNTDNVNVSLFNHNLETNKIKVLNIDKEYKYNQYNYGYTGLADNDKEYLMAYYIKQTASNPYIKLAFIRK